MDIKTVVVLLVGLVLASVHHAEAQQTKKIPRVGVLIGDSASSSAGRIEAFRQGLRYLGYVEGQNIGIEYRYAEGVDERFSNLAAELMQLKVDIIITSGTPATQAAKNATRIIPIVMTNVADPIGAGLVASLAHPGGNITGMSTLSLGGKQLELLKEAFPNVSRVAALWTPPTRGPPTNSLAEIKVAAGALQITLQSLEVHGPNDFERAFSAIKKEHANGLMVLRSPVISVYRAKIVDFAAKSRLPAMYGSSDYVDAGGLMSYAANFTDLYRRAAVYVDKILKGTKPADLPVEQPTKFEFVINLKTAKALNLTIPQSVLFRADKVIK
jgi:putative tryptophan/tyrosine transport system substrate-binding protein